VSASSYDYAMIRVIPSLERGECLNVGVILFCRMRRFLDAQVAVDRAKLRLLAPTLDMEPLDQQLEYLVRVCRGVAGSGPIGQLSQSERFHWLVAPRSTIIQPSEVHSGLCNADPAAILQRLMQRLVL
jgi:Protein of unknown function (DUF3037).